MKIHLEKTENRVAVPAASVSILLLLLAFLRFTTESPLYALPDSWSLQFAIMLGLSIALVPIIYFVPAKRFRTYACYLRILLLFLIGYPFGRFMDIRYLTFFSVAIDINFALPWPRNLYVSFASLAGCALYVAPLSVFSTIREPPGWLDILSYFLVGSIFLSLVIALQRTIQLKKLSNERITEIDGVISRLIGANSDYLEYAARVARESTEKERERITIELHDIVGQAFTNIYAMMDGSLKRPFVDPQEIHELHFWVRDQAKKGLDDTRAVLYRLRSIKERELSGIRSLYNLVNTFKIATKILVEVEWGSLPWDIDPLLDNVIYHVVQESLINAFRHGHANKILVHFSSSDRGLVLDIQDNGVVGASGKKGIGLASMEGRVLSIGGTISFTSSDSGYRVHAELPNMRTGEAVEKTAGALSR